MYRILTISLFILTHILQAQNPEANRANIWYFGNGAGLDFSSGSPVAITNGAMHTNEGCATMCDLNGNLLMYTDGDTIWDRNHNPMPNGTGLLGCSQWGSSVQAALILPLPGSNDIYYVFTTDCGENMGAAGVTFSIVDMTLNNGLGDVTSKNNGLYAPSTETLTATLHANGIDYWIVTHEYGNSNFRAYILNNTGLNPNPIISNTGLPFTDFWGTLKFSPNGELLSFAFPNISMQNQIFSFDRSNGLITYKLSLPQLAGGTYSCSFSPDNSKIYFTDSGYLIYSFDLCSPDTLLNQKSIDTIAIATGNDSYLQCQLGPDRRLYVAADSKYSISCLNNPNDGLNFNNQSIYLGGEISTYGIPNFMDYIFNQTNLCDDEELYVPNVFSPNSDGVNDIFSIEGLIDGDEVYIYNRWGNIVYEFVNANDTWDGRTISGEQCSTGVYYCSIKRDKIEHYKGFIHLFY